MGRLREQQGRARAREQDARQRIARCGRRRRRGRPGRSSDADAPGCVPRSGHQRSSAPRSHAALLGLARGPRSVARHGPAVRRPRHGLGGARMKRQELAFEQPRELFASTPVEMEHGVRDAVRLLVTSPTGHRHAAFSDLPTFFSTGDLLVANESATLAASLDAHGPSGTYTLDLSTRYADGLWLAEPRWGPAHPGPMPIEAGGGAPVGARTGPDVAAATGVPRAWVLTSDRPLGPIL